MSREYARRARGGGNLPMIILIVGAIIVISVVGYFVFFNNGDGKTNLENTDIVTAAPTEQLATDTPGPPETPTPTPQATIEIVMDTPTPEPTVNATPTPTPAPVYQSATIWSNKSNVRDAPSLTSNIIGSVRYGETYKVYDESGHFVKIQMSNGVYGWVHTDYVVRGSEPVPAAPTSAPADSLVESATLAADSSTITITFKDSAYGSSKPTDYVNIPMEAFTVKEGGVSKLTSVSACAGGKGITLTLSGATAGAEIVLTVDGSKIYDSTGEDTGDYTKTFNAGADVTAPTVTFSGTATAITVTFNEEVYSTASASGALDSSDFTITASGGASLTSIVVTHTAGSKTVTVTLNCDISADIVIALHSSSAYDAAGNPAASSSKTYTYTAP